MNELKVVFHKILKAFSCVVFTFVNSLEYCKIRCPAVHRTRIIFSILLNSLYCRHFLNSLHLAAMEFLFIQGAAKIFSNNMDIYLENQCDGLHIRNNADNLGKYCALGLLPVIPWTNPFAIHFTEIAPIRTNGEQSFDENLRRQKAFDFKS